MHVEIMMIGTELLLGQVVDTNAAFIGTELALHGINLYQKTTIGDNRERIIQAFDEALNRADVILVSGGLGPTEDDITRDCIAELLDRPLEFRADLMEELKARFARFGRPVGENNKKQAYVPQGAIAIENPNGTAPGFIVEDDRGIIVTMPGVPRELEAMLTESVIPYLCKKFDHKGLLHYRVLKVCGMGESSVDEAIGDLMDGQNPTVGLLASPAAVRIRIAARADTLEKANALIDTVDAQVRDRLPGRVMGVDDETLEGVVDGLLKQRGWRLVLAETCTGGMIAQRLTAAGSEALVGAVVVPEGVCDTEDSDGAAEFLARSALADYDAECALAVVRDAGQEEATAAFVSPEEIQRWPVRLSRSGELGQLRASVLALEHLRRHLGDTVE
jgi:competence/damage-inducible protein CinA-like protein